MEEKRKSQNTKVTRFDLFCLVYGKKTQNKVAVGKNSFEDLKKMAQVLILPKNRNDYCKVLTFYIKLAFSIKNRGIVHT